MNEKYDLDLYSKNPYLLARERITVILIDKALSSYFNCLIAKNKEMYQQRLSQFKDDFNNMLGQGDLFKNSKSEKNIVNIALYPFVQRLLLGGDICKELPISKSFLEDYINSFELYDSYRESVIKDFDNTFLSYIVQEKKSYILTKEDK